MHICLENDLLMVMLETGHIDWDEYAELVPEEHRPKEYQTLPLFLKNKGKVSKRIIKEGEWRKQNKEPPE